MNMKVYRKAVVFLLLIGYSLTFPACEPENTPAITVEISPSTASVPKGGSKQFTATVTGPDNPAQTVTWEIVETGKKAGTTIDTTGKLTVASDEALTTLTVKATSTADTTKSGTATVTVSNITATVTGVTVSPSTATVPKGTTQQFTATVNGNNNPAQTVTWAIDETGKKAGTTINTSGSLTVAADETLTSLTVRATSTADTTKSGTAAVTVIENIFNGGETLTSTSAEQVTRKVNGYDYELWNQNKQGTTSMTIPADGSSVNGGIFKCSWNGIENVLFRAGRKYNKTQTHSEIGTFSIDYEATVSITGDVGYLSVYGWVSGGSPDDLIEYYIVERRGSYNPGSAGTNKGTVTIDGGTYTIYETTRTNQPSIEGTKTFKQYWSIRTSNRTSGTISVSEHFKAWNDKGMVSINNGKLYEVALKVEGYRNRGSAEITKNILKVNGVPIQ